MCQAHGDETHGGGRVWEAAEAYHWFMGRWSAAVAGALFDLAAPPAVAATSTSAVGWAA